MRAPIKPGNLEVHWPEGMPLLSGDAIDPDSMEPDYNATVTVEPIHVGSRLEQPQDALTSPDQVSAATSPAVSATSTYRPA